MPTVVLAVKTNEAALSLLNTLANQKRLGAMGEVTSIAMLEDDPEKLFLRRDLDNAFKKVVAAREDRQQRRLKRG